MSEKKKHTGVEHSLGKKVKQRRNAKNLTLDGLSALSGVSKAMLSQIEQDKVNPTVAVLMKIAAAIDTTVSTLLDEPVRKNILRIIRNHDEQYTYRSDENCRIRTLSPLSLEKNIEFYNVTLEGSGEIKSEPHFPGTEEILHVTRGRLEVSSAAQSSTISKGDSIHYRADVEHVIKNTGKTAAEFFLVVKYREE